MSERVYNPNNVKCPYCGYEDRDSWDLGSGDDDETDTMECGKCEREFVWQRSISITFITWPSPLPPDAPT